MIFVIFASCGYIRYMQLFHYIRIMRLHSLYAAIFAIPVFVMCGYIRYNRYMRLCLLYSPYATIFVIFAMCGDICHIFQTGCIWEYLNMIYAYVCIYLYTCEALDFILMHCVYFDFLSCMASFCFHVAYVILMLRGK